jgi:hypothetical protein
MTASGATSGGIRASLPVVISGFAIQGILLGAGVETVGVFVKAIASAEGWSTSTVSSGVRSSASRWTAGGSGCRS